MSSRGPMQRFRNGETCAECSATRWYIQDGLKYCAEGHQVEGFIQYGVEDDRAVANRGGRTARKRREVVDRERKQLAGRAGAELYLECLQLLLRRQVGWLVRERRFPTELEALVRDLWDLRIRSFPGLRSAARRPSRTTTPGGRASPWRKKKKKEERSDGGGIADDSGAEMTDTPALDGGRLAMFSSQADSSDASSGDEGSIASWGGTRRRRPKKAKLRDWSDEEWAVPGLIDTLALCYVGALLLREPVRVGDVLRWARTGQIPYLGAIASLPKSLAERLPGWAQAALQKHHAVLEAGKLHEAIRDLMLGFKANCGLTFPALNVSPMILLYLRDLSLPPDIFTYVQQILVPLGLTFSFPVETEDGSGNDSASDAERTIRFRLTTDPDTLLVACIVFATKSAYPFDGLPRLPRNASDPLCTKLSWKAWQSAFDGQMDGDVERQRGWLARCELMDPARAAALSAEEMDEYMDWFQATQLGSTRDETEIDHLFPLKYLSTARSLSQQVLEVPDEEAAARMYKVIHEGMGPSQARRLDEGKGQTGGGDHFSMASRTKPPPRLGSHHHCVRFVEELTGPARAFHEKAAAVAGLSAQDLVRAVYSLEGRVREWELGERRRERTLEQGLGDGESCSEYGPL